jgi:hypothetical protein
MSRATRSLSFPVVTGEGDRSAQRCGGGGSRTRGPLRLATLGTSPVTTGEENALRASAPPREFSPKYSLTYGKIVLLWTYEPKFDRKSHTFRRPGPSAGARPDGRGGRGYQIFEEQFCCRTGSLPRQPQGRRRPARQSQPLASWRLFARGRSQESRRPPHPEKDAPGLCRGRRHAAGWPEPQRSRPADHGAVAEPRRLGRRGSRP